MVWQFRGRAAEASLDRKPVEGAFSFATRRELLTSFGHYNNMNDRAGRAWDGAAP